MTSNGIFLKNDEDMRKLLNGSNIYIMTQLISNIDKEKLDVTVKVPHYDDICTKAFISEPVIQV